jgi:hypothetical protein
LTADEKTKFSCDVSFVSHASMPANVIIQNEIQRLATQESRRLLSGIFERIIAVYDAGGMITEPVTIVGIINQTLIETSTSIPPEQMPSLLDLFTQRINNAFFRHQSLQWVADLGINLHLYGRGWENHPTLGRFARGVADNFGQLSSIYNASKISLHISPHGAGHQRVLEGLAAGGFFLMRYCPGDFLEREYQAIRDWCRAEEISSDAEIKKWAPPQIQSRLKTIGEILQRDPFALEYPFVHALQSSEAAGYIRSAATIWGDDFEKVTHYLKDETDRRRQAELMRQVVIDRFTYVATTRRLLDFLAADQERQALIQAAA